MKFRISSKTRFNRENKRLTQHWMVCRSWGQEVYALLHKEEGPSQVILVDPNTKEASPKEMPESAAWLSIPLVMGFFLCCCHGSVLTQWERTQTCAKKKKRVRKVSFGRREGESELMANLYNTGETFFKTKNNFSFILQTNVCLLSRRKSPTILPASKGSC